MIFRLCPRLPEPDGWARLLEDKATSAPPYTSSISVLESETNDASAYFPAMQPLSIDRSQRDFLGDSSLIAEGSAAFLYKVQPSYGYGGLKPEIRLAILARGFYRK